MIIDTIEEFERHVNRTDTHWFWKGNLNHNNHGQLNFKGRTNIASRVARHLYCGFDLSSERQVLHKNECHEPSCINPDHTYEGYNSDNTNDQVEFGNHNMASKTHCKHGHEFTKENTYTFWAQGSWKRQCRKCQDLRTKKYRSKSKNELVN